MSHLLSGGARSTPTPTNSSSSSASSPTTAMNSTLGGGTHQQQQHLTFSLNPQMNKGTSSSLSLSDTMENNFLMNTSSASNTSNHHHPNRVAGGAFQPTSNFYPTNYEHPSKRIQQQQQQLHLSNINVAETAASSSSTITATSRENVGLSKAFIYGINSYQTQNGASSNQQPSSISWMQSPPVSFSSDDMVHNSTQQQQQQQLAGKHFRSGLFSALNNNHNEFLRNQAADSEDFHARLLVSLNQYPNSSSSSSSSSIISAQVSPLLSMNTTPPTTIDQRHDLDLSFTTRTTHKRARLENGGKNPNFWTAEEDEALLAAVKIHGTKKWSVIKNLIPNRNATQCQQRWSKVLTPGIKKGPWSVEEDETLIALTKEQIDLSSSRLDLNNPESGQTIQLNWRLISTSIPGRTAKQCRSRWVNNLDPSLKKTKWTVEEDQMILNLYNSMGSRWAYIANQLEGRSENAVRIRFTTLTRHKNEKEKKNDITKEKQQQQQPQFDINV